MTERAIRAGIRARSPWTTRSPTSCVCSPAGRRSSSGTATAATSRWPPPNGIRSWSARSRSTRPRCRGCRGGRAPPPGRLRSRWPRHPTRRPSGSCAEWSATTRWEALPERTRATRRREGAAMVGELTDLRDHAPWSAELVARAGAGRARRQHGGSAPPTGHALVRRHRAVGAAGRARRLPSRRAARAPGTVRPAAGRPAARSAVRGLSRQGASTCREVHVGAEERARGGAEVADLGLVLHPIGAVLQRRTLGPHAEREADHEQRRDDLPGDVLDRPTPPASDSTTKPMTTAMAMFLAASRSEGEHARTLRRSVHGRE